LVTNDDGVYAEGLWALVEELKKVSEVVVAAPDREQSGVGTAVSLHQPLRVSPVRPIIPGIETYSIEGTPADSVILALGDLIDGGADLVLSGINNGSNLGSDVLISGTVGAALQGCLRGLPSVALSVAALHEVRYDVAAKLAVLLVQRMAANLLPRGILLNINLPNLPLEEITGIEITRLAGGSYLDRIEEGHDGRRKYYWIVRDRPEFKVEEGTDVWALEAGKVSVVPLQSDLTSSSNLLLLKDLCSGLFEALLGSGTQVLK
jgi:5'-nucleotidase